MAETRTDGAPATFFDRARTLAAAVLIAAGVAAIAGALLDWVTITPPTIVPPDQASNARPYSGVDATDGWFVIGIACPIVLCGIMLGIARRGGYARFAFILSIALGAIAFADYRAVGDLDSGITQRMDLVGDPNPGFGILLVAVAALLALLGAVAGIAATPREPVSR